MKLRFCPASQTLITQFESASTSLQLQYAAVQAFADAKIMDHIQYEPYKEATVSILAYYHDVKQYAIALVNVKKNGRKEQASQAIA